jgi:hypothetical protein
LQCSIEPFLVDIERHHGRATACRMLNHINPDAAHPNYDRHLAFTKPASF